MYENVTQLVELHLFKMPEQEIIIKKQKEKKN